MQPNQPKPNPIPFVPLCPNCRKGMILARINIAPKVFFSTYLCDCSPQPGGVQGMIFKARQAGQGLVLDLTPQNVPQPIGRKRHMVQ